MKVYRVIQSAAVAVMILGIALAVPLVYFWMHERVALATPGTSVPVVAPKPPAGPALVAGKPVEIIIPSLHIDLEVIDGVYDTRTGQWTLTLNKAQFALVSTEPNNEEGNTLLYGHYRPEVFAYLHLIKAGAVANIITDTGYTFTYTYQSSQAFDPTDTSIFTYQGPPRLTIQTCSGAFFQHRQMYYFAYDGYQKNS